MLAMFANVVYSVNKCLLDYHLKEYLICTCLFPFKIEKRQFKIVIYTYIYIFIKSFKYAGTKKMDVGNS
jgi:hypothetical protein